MCTPSMIPYPDLAGAQFTSLSASLVSNVTLQILGSLYVNNGPLDVQGVSFCHVKTTYTHIGTTDNVTVELYLPEDGWNGRMQGVGGGGWIAGGTDFFLTNSTMLAAVSEGYSAVTTNGGHSFLSGNDWLLQSSGEINHQILEVFASTSLNELSIIGKAVIESYYGRPPLYSYWNGCSFGGRQGMELASRYPTAFNGIAAAAPAINFIGILMGNLWPQIVMKEMGEYPKNCELLAITKAAVEYCDGKDGLKYGMIFDPDDCDFDPRSVINETITCDDTGVSEIIRISEAAVKVAEAVWAGARTSDDRFLWWGLKKGARLVEQPLGHFVNPGIATTVCSRNGTCTGKPTPVSDQAIRLLVKKDLNFDVSSITANEFEEIFGATVEEYAVLDINPNLDAFRDAGGKILSYHGLYDAIVPPDATRDYFNSIAARDSQVHDYYRVFEAPGLAHCHSGAGGYYPSGIFKALVSWVESNATPDTLVASTPSRNGSFQEGILCPYPQKPHYNGLRVEYYDESGLFGTSADDFYCDE